MSGESGKKRALESSGGPAITYLTAGVPSPVRKPDLGALQNKDGLGALQLYVSMRVLQLKIRPENVGKKPEQLKAMAKEEWDRFNESQKAPYVKEEQRQRQMLSSQGGGDAPQKAVKQFVGVTGQSAQKGDSLADEEKARYQSESGSQPSSKKHKKDKKKKDPPVFDAAVQKELDELKKLIAEQEYKNAVLAQRKAAAEKLEHNAYRKEVMIRDQIRKAFGANQKHRFKLDESLLDKVEKTMELTRNKKLEIAAAKANIP